MRKNFSKAVSKVLVGVLCVSTICGNYMPAFGAQNGFQVEQVGSGYAITGIEPSAIADGTVTIPAEINGTVVTQLGVSSQSYTFLGRRPVKKLVIGKNVKGATAYAFFGARELEDIKIDEENRALHFDEAERILYGSAGGNGILIKYLSPTVETDYIVPESMMRIFNMDHAVFGTLDLNNVTRIEKLTFAGTEISTLKVKNVSVSGGYDILYGASVGEFDADDSAVYGSDGKALWKDGRLIKLAVGGEFDDGYFNQFTSISPYAFNSIAEYNALQNILPEELTKDVVFSFFSQDEGVFVVNGEISFCYNYDKKVPTSVGGSTEYSENIDETKYEKIKALMYVGAPFNGTGLFEDVFGEDYESVASDPDITLHGNAALNVVSAILYHTIDGKEPLEIKGIGYGPFTEENVAEYRSRLLETVEEYELYNFQPGFSMTDNTVQFHKEDGKYVSEPIQIDTLDGNGEVNNNFIYTIFITHPGITTADGRDSFKTGTSVILESTEKPIGLSVAYNEPSLKYYQRTSDDVQNVLASATRRSAIDLDVTVMVDNLVISKQDITNQKELPGASLVLERDGTIIDTWVSTTEPHIISNPEDGIYVLTEQIAPDGYEVAESITFTVKDGKVDDGKIVMYDKPISKTVSISKVDAATRKELPGAKMILELMDDDSEGSIVVEKWTSSKTPHVIAGLIDGEYRLTEITAPSGYEIAESIFFTIENGTVDGGPIIMVDKPKEATPSEATPSEPSKPTPSEPDEPSKPDNPSQPDKPSGGGGHSGGGGGSHSSGGDSFNGPGVKKETPMVVPVPIEVPVPPITQGTPLPKTGDYGTSTLIAAASFLTLIFCRKKKMSQIPCKRIRNH